MTKNYTAPEVKDLGTLADQTLVQYDKVGNAGDFVHINNQNIPIPGSQEV